MPATLDRIKLIHCLS